MHVEGNRMSRESLRITLHYSDVFLGLFTLGLAIAVMIVATQDISPWNLKDSLGLSLSLITLCAFGLLRQYSYHEKSVWLHISLLFLIFVGMVLFFRRWTILWVVGSSILLILSLGMRTKRISEPISFLDLLPMVIVLASALFTFTLLEITLRVAPGLLTEGARLRVHWWEDSQRWYILHPYIGHLHLPAALASSKTARPGLEQRAEHDPWGFRNHWPWPQQADILAVGDSFTYGQMVDDEQAWTTILAQRFPHSQVMNLGLIGGAPQQYLRIYETFGVNLAPKVLLVGIFLENDLWGAGEFGRWWKAGAKQAFPEFGSKGPTSGIRDWFIRKMKGLYFSALLQDFRESYREGRLLSGRTMKLSTGGQIQLVPSLLTYMATFAQYGRPEFMLILETIEQINALAQKNHTECLILFFPSKEEVYLPLLGEKAADLSEPFIPELKRRGIPYLNLGPFFHQQATAGKQLFFEVDGHPNILGYTLIAETIFEHLKENSRINSIKDQ
jgi:lysophospholipase L1-like esterase